ncbi:MAG TPA: hypothetical protein VHH35_08010 [Pyrinomonadaceae bacterium]|nr:hypothetical protein [Pyrinomonadaceae bacterium]
MFVRFVSGEIDCDSHVSAGLFRAAYKLLEDVWLPDYEYEALREPMNWFDEHMKSPYDYRLEPAWLAERSICWFRSTAREPLQRAWEMVAILNERGIFVRMIKCETPGYVIYEDQVQVLAYPYPDVRRLL